MPLTSDRDLMKRPTPSVQARCPVSCNSIPGPKSAKSNVAYPAMVTDQERQKEAYNLHLAAHPNLFLLVWEIPNPNTTNTTKQIPSSKPQESNEYKILLRVSPLQSHLYDIMIKSLKTKRTVNTRRQMDESNV